MSTVISDLLRVGLGGASVDLSAIDPASTPGAIDGKTAAKEELEAVGAPLAVLQEQLYAEGRTDGTRRVLVVLQGMDTSGKGGAVKHVAGLMNPAGLRITGFGPPTAVERKHDFLWRIEKGLPPSGLIGFFDRSHYEDVLIVRVHDLVPKSEWATRYNRINAWEADLAGKGVVLLKVMLHISHEEQKRRLLARLADPSKHWKVNPSDIDEREHWDAYQEAYGVALRRCSTGVAPWHVIPANRKWYRNWALSHLLLETLQRMDLRWPSPPLDLAGMRAALEAS